MTLRTSFAALLVASLLFPAFTTEAAPYTLDENLKPFELTLRDHPEANGAMWTSASGVGTGATDYLFVGGLSAKRASEIYIISMSDDNPVSVRLVQSHWDEVLEECETDGSGMCGVRFRTHGEVGFMVNAPVGTPWHLVVMTSPEVAMESMMPSPLFPALKADAARYETGAAVVASTPAAVPDSSEAKTGDWLMPALVVLLAVIAVLLVLLLRRGSAPAAVLLLFAVLVATPQRDAQATSESTGGILGAISGQLDEVQGRNAASAAVRSRVDGNIATLQKRMEVLMALRSLADEWDPLNPCAIVANPPSTPRIPTFCEGDEECTQCYGPARDKFNLARATFEDLRVIYQCSMNDINSALAFGDTASGVHGVVGLAWKAERTKIEKSVKGLKEAYDAKYTELRGRLHESMIALGSCEALYGELDWYDRFGHVYFEFLTDKYKRQD